MTLFGGVSALDLARPLVEPLRRVRGRRSLVPEPLIGVYQASKAALDNATETLGLELGEALLESVEDETGRLRWIVGLDPRGTYAHEARDVGGRVHRLLLAQLRPAR